MVKATQIIIEAYKQNLISENMISEINQIPFNETDTKILQEIINRGFLSRTQIEQVKNVLNTTPSIHYSQASSSPSLPVVNKTKFEQFVDEFIASQETSVLTSNLDPERFEILETLGEGGMGLVQSVRDKLLGREVALKSAKLKASFDQDKKRIRKQLLFWRLKREAEITAILEHPNIIPLYEMQQKNEDEIQFIMRKVEGGTLRSFLKKKREGLLSWDENNFLGIFFKVCDAVSYAHSKGIVHRDLKPENIMIGSFGEVYVLDWGIARKLQEPPQTEKEFFEQFPASENAQSPSLKTLFQTLGGMGTPGYMSPEQQQDASKINEQTDIYALGKTLRECFIFISPVEEVRLRLKLETSHSASSPPQQILLDSHLPKDLRAIIQKATEKECAKRYQTVQELVADLDSYQKYKQVSARNYNLLERLLQGAKRNKQRVFLYSSVFVLFVFFICTFQILLFLERSQTQEKQQKKFLQLYKKAQHEKKRASTLQALGNQVKDEKIVHLLESFGLINKALAFNLETEKLQDEKRNLGSDLIRLACERENYQLASQIANEINSMKTYVQNAQNKTLNEHRTIFEEWCDKLKQPSLPQGTRETALLEISKMREKEILDKVLTLVEEGATYFTSKETQRTIILNRFYTTMATALGWFQNPSARDPLLKNLEKMAQTLSPSQKKSLDQLDYMVELAEALKNSKAQNTAEALNEIRHQMGLEDYFWQKTQDLFISLALADKLAQKPAITPEEYYNRGVIRYNLNQYSEAIEDFTKAITLDSEYYQAYHYRGLTRYERWHQKKIVKNELELTLENPLQISEIKGTHELELSIQDHTKSLELAPEYYMAYIHRGHAKTALESVDSAIEDYTQAIQLKPSSSMAYRDRAMAKSKKEMHQEALEDYDKAVELNPQDIRIYNLRGLCRYEFKDFSNALLDFTQAIRLDPFNKEALFNRGLVHDSLKNYNSAIDDFSNAILLFPDFSKAYHARGEAHQKNGNLEAAFLDYNQALLLDPNFAPAYISRAQLRKEKKDFLGALSDYEQLIRLNPSAEAYNNRGQIKLNLNQIQGAIEDFKLARRYSPMMAEPYYNLGIAYQLLKENENAIVVFEEGLRLKKNEEIANKFTNLSIEWIKNNKNKYSMVLSYLLKIKEHAPSNHSIWQQLTKEIQKYEKLVKREEED